MTDNGKLPTPWLDVPLSELPLTPRAYSRLAAAGYQTLADVAAAGRTIRDIPGFGAQCWFEVKALITQRRNEHARSLLASGQSLRQVGEAMGVSGEWVRKWLVERKS